MTDELVKRLRDLADCDARAGEPLGKCMREAADEITRLRAQVAAAYEDAAKVVWPHPLGKPRKPTAKDAPEYQAVYEAQRLAFLDAQEIRNRTPDDAAAALDALLEKAVKAALQTADLRCQKMAIGYDDAGNEKGYLAANECGLQIADIDPAAIVQKVKAK